MNSPQHVSTFLEAALGKTSLLPAIAAVLNPLVPCREHGLDVELGFDGVHFIECEAGCEMHDGDNEKPDELIQRWNASN